MNTKIIKKRFYIAFLLLISVSSCGDGGNVSLFPVTVENSPPTITGSISSIRVGERLDFLPTTEDADGDVLTFSITGAPDWATFDTSSGLLSGVPVADDLGNIYDITISVSDGQSETEIGPFALEVKAPVFFISVQLETMDPYRTMDFEITSCLISDDSSECEDGTAKLLIDENGVFSFSEGIETGVSYEIAIERHPARQECSLGVEQGIIGSADLTIPVNCQQDVSFSLFDLNKLHKIRLAMDVEEWNRFVLDTRRAKYKSYANGDAIQWYRWSHSEIYRQVDFEYLNDDGSVIEKLENVGFKMKGNTSRQWPEHIYDSDDGVVSFKPRRFSFGLKFDEKFDEDEGVYSCIDSSGNAAAVPNYPCSNRIGRDLAEVPENDDRSFFGVEKLSFRFNRDDPSYQRELLAHDILNSLGIPSARVAHAAIELNIIGSGSLYGETLPLSFNMGVFQMTEQVDKPFLKRYFGKNGFLFKNGVNADLSGVEETDLTCVPYEEAANYYNPDFCQIGIEKSDPESREEWLGSQNFLLPEFVNSDINGEGEESQFKPYQPSYDLKSKKKSVGEGRQLLRDFIVFLRSYPSAIALERQFDVSGFIKAQAAEIALGAVDHYARVGNNYYLYLNPTTEKWTYIPNDFDFVFRDSHGLAQFGTPDWYEAFRDITDTYAFPADGKIHWAGRELGSVDPILWDIVFSEESNKDLLYSELKEIVDSFMDWRVLESKLSTRNRLVQSAIGRTEAVSPEGCEFIYNILAIDADAETILCDSADISIKRFVELRRATLLQELSDNGFE